MSELITTASRVDLRRQLLATVSALTLLTVVTSQATADDDDRPTVWLELGGQLERMADSQETFAPSFLGKFDHLGFKPVLPLQQALPYSVGAEGKLFFQPSGSDWIFSVAVRYGRAKGRKSSYQRSPEPFYTEKTTKGGTNTIYIHPPYHLASAAASAESHVIVDFKAGKDVGLGIFANHAASVFSLGVRFAQFASKRDTDINGVPTIGISGNEIKYGLFHSHHRYLSTASTESSFRGIGPSLSWDTSAPLAGQADEGEITFDWGVNAAALFGRQNVHGETGKTGEHYKTKKQVNLLQNIAINYKGLASSYHQHTNIDRSRSIVVPNLGGFAGLSYRYTNAKLSLGYRADFFFSAMDTGIDIANRTTTSFHGPYATISIGLGG